MIAEVLPWQWAVAGGGAFLIGLAKGGLPGVGNLSILLFAWAFGAKPSVGLLLPVLIGADTAAIVIYRRSVEWAVLWKLWPWMAVGVVIGTFTFDLLSSDALERVIGGIILAMTGLQILRTRRPKVAARLAPQNRVFAGTLGIIGGIATMLANAAGPIGQLFLLSANLPKLAFIGTAAWLFFLINLFKVPFQASLGILNFESLQVSGALMPAAVGGALLAPRLLRHINERLFVQLVWVFVVVAGVKLLIF
ncbi:MAG: sulfite exporter TauE/SafE family protein [Verrucomicrobiota bacterium]